MQFNSLDKSLLLNCLSYASTSFKIDNKTREAICDLAEKVYFYFPVDNIVIDSYDDGSHFQ